MMCAKHERKGFGWGTQRDEVRRELRDPDRGWSASSPMKRDAFAALFGISTTSSPKNRSNSSSSDTRKQEGSHLVECPICGKSVHLRLANSHVEKCIDASSSATTGTSETLATNSCSEDENSVSSQLTSVSNANGTRHDPESSCQEVVGCFSPPTVSTNEKSFRTEGDCSPSAPDMEDAKPPATKRSRVAQIPARDAFSALMDASALGNFKEEIYLWRHKDDTISWGWGPAGSAQPPPPDDRSASDSNRSWTCEVATKGPDGRKAGMCEIWTNLPSVMTTGVEGKQVHNPYLTTSRFVGGADNSGIRARSPKASLSRLSVPVLKSMLQKNVRRNRGEPAVRCALELAIKSWSDAIRRVLVIMVEDSLLHPAAPFLTWLMAATSKGYRPPRCLLRAFLCVVHEIATCPLRDTTESLPLRNACDGQGVDLQENHFPPPHPRDLVPPTQERASQGETRGIPYSEPPHQGACSADVRILGLPRVDTPTRIAGSSCPVRDVSAAAIGEGDCGGHVPNGTNSSPDVDVVDVSASTRSAGASIACCRRALLMRMAYGGMSCDQSMLKGACLSWGERTGHVVAGGTASRSSPANSMAMTPRASPPCPKELERVGRTHGGHVALGYMHGSAAALLRENEWTTFLVSAHAGCGIPPPLLGEMEAHLFGSSSHLPQAGASVDGVARTAGTGQGNPRPRDVGPILRETDAILSGVDYHCSNVLDEVLVSGQVMEKAARASRDDGGSRSQDAMPGVSAGNRNGLSVMSAARRAMWVCSSGVNARRVRVGFEQGLGVKDSGAAQTVVRGILVAVSGSDEESGVDKRVWEALRVSVEDWTQTFVRRRLQRDDSR